jgi:ubiquinone/menaquinone biosynthesis C-methylase UbiE
LTLPRSGNRSDTENYRPAGELLMAGSFETWRATTSIPGSLIPSRRFREVLSSARTLIGIGCGVGRLTAVLERKRGQTIGVDCNISALRSGAFIDVSSRIVGDARQLPFRDGVAHAVSLQAVLTVIPGREDQLRLASEVSRVLTGGGVVYVADFLRNDGDPTMSVGTCGVPEVGLYL